MTYQTDVRDRIIQNGFTAATSGNGPIDPNWSACVACAVLQRGLLRTGTPIPNQCNSCYLTLGTAGTVISTPATSVVMSRGTSSAKQRIIWHSVAHRQPWAWPSCSGWCWPPYSRRWMDRWVSPWFEIRGVRGRSRKDGMQQPSYLFENSEQQVKYEGASTTRPMRKRERCIMQLIGIPQII